MKAIMMSIRPEWIAKILNGEKTIEIRKKFPSDYVGWVYIYCTKDSKNGWCMVSFRKSRKHYYQRFSKDACYSPLDNYIGNGKVVARFWCDKVEEMYYCDEQYLKPSCLSIHEMFDYLKDKTGYAIHITGLEIFDKPREIKEFSKKEFDSFITGQIEHYKCPLTRAPQSWCYVEI